MACWRPLREPRTRCPSTRTSAMPHPVIHEEPPTVKSDLETLNPTRVKLTVEVPFEELAPSLDAAYKKIGSR